VTEGEETEERIQYYNERTRMDVTAQLDVTPGRDVHEDNDTFIIINGKDSSSELNEQKFYISFGQA
jgi:hypothetical protein